MTRLLALILVGLIQFVGYAQPASVDVKASLLPDPAQFAGKRVMILGDSITQDGRYASYIEYFLQKNYPQLDFDVINVGLASETTSGLSEEGHPGPRPCIHARLDLALADIKPAWVIACYGMNDGIYLPLNDERFNAFKQGVSELVAKCEKSGAEVLLITPPVYDVVSYGGLQAKGFDYNEVLDAYAKWELESKPEGAYVLNLHVPMTEALKSSSSQGWKLFNSGDGVHPTEHGHWVMATLILRELGVEVADGSASGLDMVGKDPMYELIRKRHAMRGDGWRRYVGYTRVNQTVPPHEVDIDQIEKQSAQLQQEIDSIRRPK